MHDPRPLPAHVSEGLSTCVGGLKFCGAQNVKQFCIILTTCTTWLF